MLLFYIVFILLIYNKLPLDTLSPDEIYWLKKTKVQSFWLVQNLVFVYYLFFDLWKKFSLNSKIMFFTP